MLTHKFLILTCHIGQTQKERIKQKHTVRAGQDSPPLTVLVLEYQHNTCSHNLVLEYQRNTGSQNFSFGIPNFNQTF